MDHSRIARWEAEETTSFAAFQEQPQRKLTVIHLGAAQGVSLLLEAVMDHRQQVVERNDGRWAGTFFIELGTVFAKETPNSDHEFAVKIVENPESIPAGSTTWRYDHRGQAYIVAPEEDAEGLGAPVGYVLGTRTQLDDRLALEVAYH